MLQKKTVKLSQLFFQLFSYTKQLNFHSYSLIQASCQPCEVASKVFLFNKQVNLLDTQKVKRLAQCYTVLMRYRWVKLFT